MRLRILGSKTLRMCVYLQVIRWTTNLRKSRNTLNIEMLSYVSPSIQPFTTNTIVQHFSLSPSELVIYLPHNLLGCSGTHTNSHFRMFVQSQQFITIITFQEQRHVFQVVGIHSTLSHKIECDQYNYLHIQMS